MAAPFAADGGPTRRLLLLAGLGCLTVVLTGLAWIVVTALIARGKLQHAESQLPQLRAAVLAGDMQAAQAMERSIQADAAAAHALVSGPAWWVGANLPWLGAPLETTRVVARASDQIGTTVVPGLVALVDSVDRSRLAGDGRVAMSSLATAAPIVARASAALGSAVITLDDTAGSSWLPVVDHSRDILAAKLTSLDAELSGANAALRTAVRMLGGHGPRRYFIGFMNEAEARGLGGVPGAFAIISVDHGAFRFTHFGNDDDLAGVSAHVNLGRDFVGRYESADPTGVFQNSDISPDFRDAARIWAGMWQAKTGEHIDGAIAVDPTALSYLMQITGAASLPAGGQVDAGNVVSLTQQQEYSAFPQNTHRRKQFVIAVSKAIAGSIINGRASSADLLKAAVRGVDERRIMLWSAHKGEEATILAHGYGGALTDQGGSMTGFTVVNGAGSKLDYYLDRSMSYRRTGCGSHSAAVARLTLHNAAPSSGLPSYVTTRADRPTYRTRPGDSFLIVTYYATPDASIDSVQLDGKAVPVAIGSERGFVTITIGVELQVDASRTLTVTLHERAGNGSVQVLQQPLARQLSIQITGAACAG